MPNLWYHGFLYENPRIFSLRFSYILFFSCPPRLVVCEGEWGGPVSMYTSSPNNTSMDKKENWPWSKYMLWGSGQYLTSEGQVGITTWTSWIVVDTETIPQPLIEDWDMYMAWDSLRSSYDNVRVEAQVLVPCDSTRWSLRHLIAADKMETSSGPQLAVLLYSEH